MARSTKSINNEHSFRTDLEQSFSLTRDRWGHYKFTARSGKIYRIKFQKQSVRLESKSNGMSHYPWLRVVTASFNNENSRVNFKNYIAGIDF